MSMPFFHALQFRLLARLSLLFCMICCVCARAAEDTDGKEWRASNLRPGDVLQINVFRGEEFNKTVRIEEDGWINFPFCGQVKASGRSTKEVADELQKLLAPQLAEPVVDIFVTAWGPRTIYLLGEFRSGSCSMELPTYGRLTALQAISSAGGFSDSADLANVYVLRRLPDGQLKRIPVDVSALVGGDISAKDNFVMLPEDTLLAPRAAAVSISGKVGAPSTINIDTKKPPHVSELVIRAGGLADGADAANIVIVRPGKEGKLDILPVSLKTVSLGIYENDPLVAPGDSIVVGEAKKIYVVGCVNQTSALVLSPDTTITASQAITLAGGFKTTASQGGIVVIRGTERIKVDLGKLYAKEGKLENDIPLVYGDIVYVPESFW